MPLSSNIYAEIRRGSVQMISCGAPLLPSLVVPVLIELDYIPLI